MDGVLEAVRVFGNLSQDRDVCDFIVRKNRELLTLESLNMHFLPVNSGADSELGPRQCDACFRFGRSECLTFCSVGSKAVSSGCQDGRGMFSVIPLPRERSSDI